jgi:energy-coupling factor transporter ATP-binding protein EcfA2
MTMATNGAAIETSGVSFVYEGGHQALFDVDVTIGAGEFVALVGQNGSGKTTLAKHFNGILRPTSGRVTIDGVDVADQSTTNLAGRIGYCYQNPDHQIFAHTVRAELEFGPQNLGVDVDVVAERVERLLDVVGLKHMADSYPFGLSRGERQKVAVASVLAMEPQVVIVDEPTTGLDWLGGQAMMDIIRAMHDDGRTVIVITHDMHLVAEYAERVIVMADGRKVADGAPGAVFREDVALKRAALRPPQVFRMSRLLPDLLGDGSLTVEAAVAHLDTLGHAAAVGDEY